MDASKGFVWCPVTEMHVPVNKEEQSHLPIPVMPRFPAAYPVVSKFEPPERPPSSPPNFLETNLRYLRAARELRYGEYPTTKSDLLYMRANQQQASYRELLGAASKPVHTWYLAGYLKLDFGWEPALDAQLSTLVDRLSAEFSEEECRQLLRHAAQGSKTLEAARRLLLRFEPELKAAA